MTCCSRVADGPLTGIYMLLALGTRGGKTVCTYRFRSLELGAQSSWHGTVARASACRPEHRGRGKRATPRGRPA